MKSIYRAKALLLCALILGLFVAPAAADNYPKAATDRTVVYFGAPW